jgi:hypothetical protein
VPAQPADLALGPATRLLWRGPDSVHLELGSRAVVVTGLDAEVIRQVASPTRRSGSTCCDEPSGQALTSLAEAGYLWPRRDGPDDDRLAVPVPRLAGELAALAARHGERAGEVLGARRECAVAVFGASRAAPHIAALLGAAGVGRVHCTAPGAAKLRHVVPGGFTPADEGAEFTIAADAAVRRAAPDVDTTPLSVGAPPDLTVLTLDAPADSEQLRGLHAAGTAHLAVSLGVDYGVVGPLVVPGLTCCLHCTDLHRRDRDPAWSALAVQLAIPRRYGPASDVAIATIIAGVAALQALMFLDGDEPACIDGTLELRLPDWRLRRRSWPIHPECECTAMP